MPPKVFAKALELIKDPGLIFVVVIVGFACFYIPTKLQKDTDPLAVLAFLGPVTVVAITCLWLRYRHVVAKHGEHAAWEHDRAVLTSQIEELTTRARSLEIEAGNPRAAVITKQDYARILQEWNAAEGEGQVLLYNIELQSFENREVIERTWGDLQKLTHIKEVSLLLPTPKVRRWERVVVQQEQGFFKDQANQKFSVCEFDPGVRVGEAQTPLGIAFAMYRFLSGPKSGQLHEKAVWFVMSAPFSQLRDAWVEGDAKWWDYEHIVALNGRVDLMARAIAIWEPLYQPNMARDVPRVIVDAKPLEPIQPADLFTQLALPAAVRSDRLRNFEPRDVKERIPLVLPFGKQEEAFSIRYDNGEAVEGCFTVVNGLVGSPRPGLIWVGGFTEKKHTKLPKLFEAVLKKEDIVQFYYEVSPQPCDVTLSRYIQDMREVLEYVNAQTHLVVPNKQVLVARSINGLLAALVAAEPKYRRMLAGVILVAPVFDVVEMMDNYRKQRQQGQVTVEKCWRRSRGFSNGQEWESPHRGWLEFFGQHVHLTILADIIRQPPETYSRTAFKRAVGAISQTCPVYVLSHPNDPITGSEEALRELKRAAEGTGLIRAENYTYLEIESRHMLPEDIDTDAYPFVLKQEARSVQKVLRELLDRVGLPTQALPAEDAAKVQAA